MSFSYAKCSTKQSIHLCEPCVPFGQVWPQRMNSERTPKHAFLKPLIFIILSEFSFATWQIQICSARPPMYDQSQSAFLLKEGRGENLKLKFKK